MANSGPHETHLLGFQTSRRKARFQMNLCLVCNAAFVAEKVDSTDAGVVSFLNLCNVLQVPSFQEFVPESNPLCLQCSAKVNEYLKLQIQIKDLMDKLAEMRRVLGTLLVETYSGTPNAMKNYVVKGKIYKIWDQKLNGIPRGQPQTHKETVTAFPKQNTSVVGERNTDKTRETTQESADRENATNLDYTLLDISNSVSSSTSVCNLGNASAPCSVGGNHDENSNPSIAMDCPSLPPSPPHAYDDTGPPSDHEEDVYIKNLNDEEGPTGKDCVQNASTSNTETGHQANSGSGAEEFSNVQNVSHQMNADLRKPIKDPKWIDKRKFRPIIATATQRRTHPCKFCGKLFPAQFSLQMHERTHTGERPFNCSICGRAFAAKAAMQKHELTHDKSRYEGEPKYECELCGKKYHLERSLYTHKRDHMGIKRLKRIRYPKNPNCPSSKKKYKYPKKPKDPNAPPKPKKEATVKKDGQKKRVSRKKVKEIKLDPDGNPIPEKIPRRKRSPKPISNRPKRTFFHRRKPGTPKEPVTCDHCGKQFKERYTLNLHIMVHTGEKPLQCPFPECPKSFRIKGNLDKHMKTHDTQRFEGEPPHICEHCGKGFYILGTLYHHRRRKHLGIRYKKKTRKLKEPVKCGICDKQFASLSGLYHHRPTHGEPKFNCEVCGKPFHYKPDALDHAKRHEPTWMYKTYFRIKCSGCPPEKLPFQSKLAIREHWAIAHKDKKLPDVYKKPRKPKKPPGYYVCTLCPEGNQPRYNQQGSLYKHKKTHHSVGKSKKKWKPRGSGVSRRQKEISEDEMSNSQSSSENEEDCIDFDKEPEKSVNSDNLPVRRSVRKTRGDTRNIAKLLMEESDNESGEDVSDIFPKAYPTKKKAKNTPASTRQKAQISQPKSVRKNTEQLSKFTETEINRILGGRVVTLMLEKIDKLDGKTEGKAAKSDSCTASKSSPPLQNCMPSKRQNVARRRGKPPGKRHEPPELSENNSDPAMPVLERVSEAEQEIFMPFDEDFHDAPDLQPRPVEHTTVASFKEEPSDEMESTLHIMQTNTSTVKRPNFANLIIHNPLSKNKASNPIIISAQRTANENNSNSHTTVDTTNQACKAESTDENETVLGI